VNTKRRKMPNEMAGKSIAAVSETLARQRQSYRQVGLPAEKGCAGIGVYPQGYILTKD
jgi:hypothetical protein